MYRGSIIRVLPTGFYHLIFLFAGFGLSSVASSQTPPADSAQQLLMEMVEAVKGQTYRGTVVYLRENAVETMQIFHSRRGEIEQERIVALNTPMREVVRSGDKVTCYFPDSKTILVDNQPTHRSFLVQLPENIEKYSRFYDFDLAGHEYVIRKKTRVVHLNPRDDYRYGRKIWIDLETRLPLKFELLDEKGKLVEQMMFTDLQIVDSIPQELLSAPSTTEIENWEIRDREHMTDVSQSWVFGNIPGGFHQIFHRKRVMPSGSKEGVEHILFSDGFSSVSVYVDKNPEKSGASTRKKMGAINSYSRLLNGYEITVLGAVPGKTVQTIGDGMDLMEASTR